MRTPHQLSAALKKLQCKIVPSAKMIWTNKKPAEDNLSLPSTPTATNTKKGHFAIYVGRDWKRYTVPLTHLKHPVFVQLLHKAEEEFGLNSTTHGGLHISCDSSLFERLMLTLENNNNNNNNNNNLGEGCGDDAKDLVEMMTFSAWEGDDALQTFG